MSLTFPMFQGRKGKGCSSHGSFHPEADAVFATRSAWRARQLPQFSSKLFLSFFCEQEEFIPTLYQKPLWTTPPPHLLQILFNSSSLLCAIGDGGGVGGDGGNGDGDYAEGDDADGVDIDGDDVDGDDDGGGGGGGGGGVHLVLHASPQPAPHAPRSLQIRFPARRVFSKTQGNTFSPQFTLQHVQLL